MWGVTLGKSLPSLGLSFLICKYGVWLGLALMYGVDVQSSQQFSEKVLPPSISDDCPSLGLHQGVADTLMGPFHFRRETCFLRPGKATVRQRAGESAGKGFVCELLPNSLSPSASGVNRDLVFLFRAARTGTHLWVGGSWRPGGPGQLARPEGSTSLYWSREGLPNFQRHRRPSKNETKHGTWCLGPRKAGPSCQTFTLQVHMYDIYCKRHERLVVVTNTKF